MEIKPAPPPTTIAPEIRKDLNLRKVSNQLEASFVTEMLKATGLGKASESFGGGEGEDQFSSFLVSAQADAIVQAGGIGLSESIFHALKGRSGE